MNTDEILKNPKYQTYGIRRIIGDIEAYKSWIARKTKELNEIMNELKEHIKKADERLEWLKSRQPTDAEIIEVIANAIKGIYNEGEIPITQKLMDRIDVNFKASEMPVHIEWTFSNKQEDK